MIMKAESIKKWVLEKKFVNALNFQGYLETISYLENQGYVVIASKMKDYFN